MLFSLLTVGLVLGAPVEPLPSPIVQPAWLAGNLMDPKLVVLHVGRSRAAYDSAHVAGARFVDFAQVITTRNGIAVELPEPDHLADLFGGLGIGEDSRVVIYGDLLAAARLWFTLDWLGHGDRAGVLDGGLEAWRSAGYPVTTEAPSPATARFVARPNADRVVDAEWVKSRLGSRTPVLLDARSPEEFRGEKQEEGVPRPGHVPGAKNLDWNRTVTNGRFRSLEEIRTLFEQAGVRPGDDVVTYCRTGTRAAVLQLLARALGYQARLYDGSMMDWSRRDDLPLTTGSN